MNTVICLCTGEDKGGVAFNQVLFKKEETEISDQIAEKMIKSLLNSLYRTISP